VRDHRRRRHHRRTPPPSGGRGGLRRALTARHGVTLIELAVAFIIVGILAGVAYATLNGVRARAADENTLNTVAAAMRAIDIHHASRTDGSAAAYHDDDFTAVGGSTHAADLLSFASDESVRVPVGLEVTTAASTRYGQLAYKMAPGAREVGVAMRSETGNCAFGALNVGRDPTVELAGNDVVCTGHASGQRLLGWDPIDGPDGAMPDVPEDHTAEGTFTLSEPGQLLLSDEPDGDYDDALTLNEGQLTLGDPDATISVQADADDETSVDAANVIFDPQFAFHCNYHFYVRSRDEAGNLSDPVQVPAAILQIPNPTTPQGALAATVENTSVSATFTSTGYWRPAFYFEVATHPDGPYTRDTAEAGLGQVTVTQDVHTPTREGQLETQLTFTPDLDVIGEDTVYLRVTDGINKTSAPAAVELTVHCDTSVSHVLASDCAVANGPGLVANQLAAANRTVVYGDSIAYTGTTISNNAEMQAGDVPDAGTGSIIGGDLEITNGSNLTVAGDVWLDGDLVNNDPATHIGGNVASYAGNIIANRRLQVDGNVTVNTPQTIDGDVRAGGDLTAGDNLVGAPPIAALPVYDESLVGGFHHSFDSAAGLDHWWHTLRPGLGSEDVAIELSGDGHTVLDLSGTLHANTLIVADGPVTIAGLPAPDGTVPDITIVSLESVNIDVSTPDGLRATVYAADAAAFTSQTIFAGQVLAPQISVHQQTELHARPPASWAGQILVEPPID
jgi:prepilin-type N-terminal cleavage/methylation domain-containing protein